VLDVWITPIVKSVWTARRRLAIPAATAVIEATQLVHQMPSTGISVTTGHPVHPAMVVKEHPAMVVKELTIF
jgi:hypothetical protein